jgi:hypothetical protein
MGNVTVNLQLRLPTHSYVTALTERHIGGKLGCDPDVLLSLSLFEFDWAVSFELHAI